MLLGMSRCFWCRVSREKRSRRPKLLALRSCLDGRAGAHISDGSARRLALTASQLRAAGARMLGNGSARSPVRSGPSAGTFYGMQILHAAFVEALLCAMAAAQVEARASRDANVRPGVRLFGRACGRRGATFAEASLLYRLGYCLQSRGFIASGPSGGCSPPRTVPWVLCVALDCLGMCLGLHARVMPWLAACA